MSVTITWLGDTNGGWENKRNWEPNRHPGKFDNVLIGASEVGAYPTAYLKNGHSFDVANMTINSGDLDLDSTGACTVSGNLYDAGSLRSDSGVSGSASSLTIGGKFTIASGAHAGNLLLAVSAEGDILDAGTIQNGGDIRLGGNAGVAAPGARAELDATSIFENDGRVFIGADVETVSCKVTGGGDFTLQQKATVVFDSSVAAGQRVILNDTDSVTLGNAIAFHADIGSFHGRDTIDLPYFENGATTFTYAENADNTSGVLTLTDGAKTATIDLTNIHQPGLSQADFSLGPDGGKGTLVHFV